MSFLGGAPTSTANFVCMFVCMFVHMFVHMFVRLYFRLYVHSYVRDGVRMSRVFWMSQKESHMVIGSIDMVN